MCNDMGRPELVYRFMDIAGHNALWNSRRGAALVGEALANSSHAAELLKPHFDSLFPKLYQFSYDPVDAFASAMGRVLSALCSAAGFKNVGAALTENLDRILSFLLQSMGSRQWRTRQAASAGLRDAILSRRFEDVQLHLADIWRMTFRAMDDIKETVREAAQKTGRSVSSLSVRLCDPIHSTEKGASEAVNIILPIVLEGFSTNVCFRKDLKIEKFPSTELAVFVHCTRSRKSGSSPCALCGTLSNAGEVL